jgi:hypothetical protein
VLALSTSSPFLVSSSVPSLLEDLFCFCFASVILMSGNLEDCLAELGRALVRIWARILDKILGELVPPGLVSP